MMKFVALLLCVVLVASVPVAEVPEKKVETPAAAPAPVAETPAVAKAETPVAVKTETPAVAEKTETPATETKSELERGGRRPDEVDTAAPVKTETKSDLERGSGRRPDEVDTAAPAKTETKTEVDTPQAPAPAKTETDTVKLIASMIETLASNNKAGEEHKSILALMQSGMDIVAEAEKKAKEIQSKIESQNLLQSDNMFGIKEDGTIDATAAADQITNLVNIFVGPNTVSDKDKEMLHSMIDTVSQIVTPLMNSSPNAAPALPSAQAIESLLKLVMPPTENKKDELLPSAQAIEAMMKLLMPPVEKHDSKDALLQPETLLSMFDDKSEIDFNALTDLATKFIESFEQQQ